MNPTPLLDSIAGPEDLRRLPPNELPRLAEEIRRRMTDVVVAGGGHLASNLGVVELTVALHRVFDFRRDRLVLDVGHQCYAHKLLTGRHGGFETLRTRGGVSGFPNPTESEYDLFVTGHASTAISTALGLAAAERGSARRPGEPARSVVALVGDGAVQGGLAFEGLNHAGHLGTDLLVILNDNEMSISRTVGALSRHLSRLRADPRYNELRREFGRLAGNAPVIGGIGRRLAEVARRAFTGGGVFQDLGFRYFGPVDGHDIQDLEATLREVKSLGGPVLLHVFTQKGRGYAPAAADPEAYHSATPCKVRTAPEFAGPEAAVGEAGAVDRGPAGTYSDAAARALCELGSADERIVAVTAAMPEGTGLAHCAAAWPERVYDVGICEAHAVTFAAGLARAGKHPVVALYSTFLQRAYDSVFHDICLQSNLGVTFLIDRAGLVGADGPTHHGLYDMAFLRTLPNIMIAAPRDGDDLAALLAWAVEQPRPVAIRYPRSALPKPVAPPAAAEPGRAEVLAEGGRVALVACGAMVSPAAAALAELARDGARPTLVSARFVKPLDDGLLARLASSHERIVTVEEGALAGGFGSAVLESAERNGWDAGRVRRLGVPDEFVPHARRAEQLADLGLDAAGIVRAVRDVLAGRARPGAV